MARFKVVASSALFSNVVSRIDQGSFMRKSVGSFTQPSLNPGNTQKEESAQPAKRTTGTNLVFQAVQDEETQGPLFPPTQAESDEIESSQEYENQNGQRTNGQTQSTNTPKRNPVHNQNPPGQIPSVEDSSGIQFASTQSKSGSSLDLEQRKTLKRANEELPNQPSKKATDISVLLSTEQPVDPSLESRNDSLELQVDRTTQSGECNNSLVLSSDSAPVLSQVIVSSQAEITSGQRISEGRDSIGITRDSIGLISELEDGSDIGEHLLVDLPSSSQLVNDTTLRALLRLPETLEEIERNVFYNVSARVEAIYPDASVVKPFGRTLKIGEFHIVLVDGGAQLVVEFHTEAEMLRFFGLGEVEEALGKLQQISQLGSLVGKKRAFTLERRILQMKSGYIYSYWGTTSLFSELLGEAEKGESRGK